MKTDPKNKFLIAFSSKEEKKKAKEKALSLDLSLNKLVINSVKAKHPDIFRE